MASVQWELAETAATAAGVELEPLESLEDADQILEVMTSTWGVTAGLPSEVIRALQESGNVPWGAFESGRLVGFVLDWAGFDDVGLHVHSHMLAVDREWQGKGAGFALKLAQRAVAIDRGIGLVRWTFDPMLTGNAYFNLAKLGAYADGFRRNFYGAMDDDLNRGERSDRLVIRWELDRDPEPGVVPDEGTVVLDREGAQDRPEPVIAGDPADAGAGPLLIRIPEDYRTLAGADRELAQRWREAVAETLGALLDHGKVVRGFTSSATYVLD
ncbi:MAG: GNAT family N-acetyltransferase [Actinomycetota bacterium]